MARRMLQVEAPMAEAEGECSFAEEYDGPPISYEIPRAIPIEIDHIPVASVAPARKLVSLCVPVVQPLPSPDPIKRPSKEDDEFYQSAEAAVSPTSVIAFNQTVTERLDHDISGDIVSTSSGALGCSPEVPDQSRELSDGASEVVGFSTEFKDDVDFSNDANASTDQVTTGSALSSDGFGFPSSSPEDDDREMPDHCHGQQVPFEDHEVESRASHAENASVQQEPWEGSDQRAKKRSCNRCHKGNRFTEKEVCLVCDSKFCSSCLLKAMGSMPEGRKCVTCIGLPIDERKRDHLGKCSRMLKKLLSPLEVQQVMKAEKFCEANHLRAENVLVNGKHLSQEEMILLQNAPNPPEKLKPGHYWYDKVSGFWGKEGHKPHKIVTPHLNVGGNLAVDASNGATGVFINNREITKSELRMLQWAGVQCAGCPHFWVNADGSYQEEGQRNIKGNLWNKAGMKLVCSLLSLPTPCKAIVIPGEEVYNVTSRPLPDYYEQRTLQKVLLIGYHQSGTSTIFKQAKFLYKPVPFSEGEHESIKLLIQTNIYKYLGILLEGRKLFEEESLIEMERNRCRGPEGDESNPGDQKTVYTIGPRLKAFSDWLLKVMESGNLEAIFPAATREYAPLVEELWKDPAIRATYNRRSELQQLPSSADYFLERVVDISRAEYEPSQLDILYADGITSSNGLTCTDFVFPQSTASTSGFDCEEPHEPLIRYQLIRVHVKGLGENYKWLEMFEDVRLVVFCVALTDYDELTEDSAGLTRNKMLESKSLFESIVAHPTFEQMDFLLVLTKYDLLEKKIEQSPLTACDWFSGFNPVVSRHHSATTSNNGATLPQLAFHYIALKFKRVFSSMTGRKLYVTAGSGLDSESTDRALRYAREVLKWEEERQLFGAGDDFDTYSSEPSSSP